MVAPKDRLISLCMSFIFIVVLVLSSSTTTFADSTPVTITVSSGTLAEVTTISPIPSVTLNGLYQTVTYTLALTTTDATGSGNGWNLTITSTQFKTTGGTPKTLSTSASTITGVTVTCVDGSTCTA